MIQKTDIFTPIIDDPYIQGKIAACNMTNDVFACGATSVNSVLCFLAAPVEVPHWVLSRIILGFQDFVKEFGSGITGGHTIINPWVLIGGMATGFVDAEHLVTHAGAKEGDILILTKPLGVQPAMALYRIMKRPEYLSDITETIPESELQTIIDKAVTVMLTSNVHVTRAMRDLQDATSGSFKVHAMTDVTGFGLAGHAENLAVGNDVDIIITKIPHIKWTLELSRFLGYDMENGRSAETAGGVLLCIAEGDRNVAINALEKQGIDHHEVGRVVKGTGKVTMSKDVEFETI